MEDFLPFEDIIKRDIKIDEEIIKESKQKVYQLQSSKNNDFCNVVFVGEFEKLPIVQILKETIDNFICTLLSFVTTEDDILNGKSHMIGFIIHDNTNIVATLMFTFLTDKKTITDEIKGKFKIVLTKIENDKGIEYILDTYDEYPGREESIYILTQLLIENVKRIKEKT
jgi:hypothetical protein